MTNKELKNDLQYTIEEAVNEMYLNSDAHDFFAQVNIDIIDNVVNVEVNYVQEYDKLMTNEEND